MSRRPPYSARSVVSDIDLDVEEVHLSDGTRLTEARAEQLAAEVLAEVRRRNLVPVGSHERRRLPTHRGAVPGARGDPARRPEPCGGRGNQPVALADVRWSATCVLTSALGRRLAMVSGPAVAASRCSAATSTSISSQCCRTPGTVERSDSTPNRRRIGCAQ